MIRIEGWKHSCSCVFPCTTPCVVDVLLQQSAFVSVYYLPASIKVLAPAAVLLWSPVQTWRGSVSQACVALGILSTCELDSG
jgi:hypothetical protein